MIHRRRFIQISAAAFVLQAPAKAAEVYRWQGMALGARASIRLAHPDAASIVARAQAEITRLESIFSLYRPGSAIVRLNGSGRLENPPFELLECLSLAGTVHHATEGRFDPTVQNLWQAHASAAAEGRSLTDAERAEALLLTGWDGVTLSADAITLRPGMAITLNGIAQGYIADRIAASLRDEGLTDLLIDTGELHAVGGNPNGGSWPVTLAGSGLGHELREAALATSSPTGTVLDAKGRVGHILDPFTGRPVPPIWKAVTVTAPSAALSDALSTAACLCSGTEEIVSIMGSFQGARLVQAVR